MTALLTLAPGLGARRRCARARSPRARGRRRELAAVALGQSRSDDALTVLLDALEHCPRAEEREPLLRGVGLHRSEPRARGDVGDHRRRAAADARAAIESLTARRFEPGLAERVRAAAASNDRAELGAIVDEVFGAAARDTD